MDACMNEKISALKKRIEELEHLESERRRAEEALLASEAKFRTIFDRVSDGILIADATTKKFLQGNKAICSMLGYNKEEIETLAVHDIHPPGDLPHVLDQFELQIRGEIVLAENLPVLRKDGSIFHADIGSAAATIGDTRCLVGLFHDITERKKVAEVLAEAARVGREWQSTFDATNDAIWILDRDQRVLRTNRTAEWLFHRPFGEMIGKHCWEIVHGTEQPIPECPILRVRKGLRRETMELQMGERWFEVIADPILDAAGRYSGAVHIISDITVRKRAGEKIKASLLEKETMLKEIHHRVKNNLQVISSLLGLQSSYIKDDESREFFQQSQDRVKIMAQIHTMLYQSEDLARVDFGGFISDMVSRLRQSYAIAGSPIEVFADIADVSLTIGTSIPCGLILNELVSNALKHAFPEGKGGKIDVRMRSDGDQVVFSVQDNGIGLSESVDICNPRSLGLELVNLLVGQMDGRMDMQVNGGTTWAITFPIKKEREWKNG
jgi:PAS domain S-box-containing protein